MAMLDFTKATASVDMADHNLVTFKSPGATYPVFWNYGTPLGSSVAMRGENMTFDASGHATGGTVTEIELDTGAYDATRPEVKITGIGVAAAALDDGPESFWRFLEGNDVIAGPSQAALPNSEYRFFGDGIAARTGTSTGGNDIVQPGNVTAAVYGDVVAIGVQTAGAPKADYRGGADDIAGAATTAFQVFVGDADIVNASGKLTGGNDTIYIQSTHEDAAAFGDATFVQGVAGDIAEFIGGNDYIAGGPDFRGTLVGDTAVLKEFTVARGGNDRIEGGGVREHIYGDVQYVIGGTLTGGADRLSGNGGGDTISGEAERIESGARVYGGNDTIYGGAGGDRIYGETAYQSSLSIVTGGDDIVFGEAGDDVIEGQTGNDQLYGGADADRLYGGTGNDLLDGGLGADELAGGSGNDYYVVGAAGDELYEDAGQGIDTVLALLNSFVLGDNFENLTSLAAGNFVGIGNGLANVVVSGAGEDAIAGRAGNDTLISGSGDDQLHGEDGNDVMDGGLGRDRFEGGDGFDTVSYASAGQGVRFSLDGSLATSGDAVGDNHLGVEALSGSAFADVLRGDSLNNRLAGEAGNDLLQGQAGNDLIVGGLGGDVLFGGAGNDRFDFSALAEAGDSIRDFANTATENDTLRFDDAGFGGLPLGALAAKYFTANAAGVATTADHRFVYETDTGILRFDANGSAEGGRTIVATLMGAPVLTAGDFFMI